MRNIIVLCTALLLSWQIMAQESRRVTGIVIGGNDNAAMIGVNVIEKGTGNGTVTKVDGSFALTLTTRNPVLVFSSLGYTTVEEVVGNRTNLRIVLNEDLKTLSEVVVVGYGTMKKSDLSGAAVTVGEDKIKGSIITNNNISINSRTRWGSCYRCTSCSAQTGCRTPCVCVIRIVACCSKCG